jgi:cysteine desulfurase
LKSVSNHFFPTKKKIISTPIEHPSIINTLGFLKTQGIVVEYCPVDRLGRVLLPELEKLIDDDTFLVCCMLANNEIGTIQDIHSIAKIARQHKVLVLCDCVQAFGKIPIDVQDLGIDYATFSAHKLYGPKGVGALYIKQGSPFSPFMHGGHQENGMRAGTESLHNIAGFGVACREVEKLLTHSNKIGILKNQFIKQIQSIKPDCVINSPESDCLPNTISITFPNTDNAALLAMLDYHGIAVSSGSACSAQEDKPSHVLKAIGLSDEAAKETIRFSLGCSTTAGDIRYAAKVFRNFVEGRSLHVTMVTPAQLNEAMLFDEQFFILDVRPQSLRLKIKSLPNSHEASFYTIDRFIRQLPTNKHILVVCQKGNFSYVVSYYLKSKGFDRVSNLLEGMVGWKISHSDLYEKYSGQNVTVLKPEG